MRKILLNPLINTALFALILLLGATVVLGWKLEIPALVRVFPGLAPMQFNNALCFVLLGLSGMAYLNNIRWACTSLAGLGIVISGLTLLQYPLGLDFGIDLLLAKEETIVKTAYPGRMAPNSALSHLLAFSTLCLLRMGKVFSIRTAGWTGATVLGLGLVSLAGYVINPKGGYSWGELTQMAIHTSFGFVIAGVAFAYVIAPKRMSLENKAFNLWPYMILLLLVVFFIDMQIPQGVAVGLLYLIPIMLSWFFNDRRNILIVAAAANVLIVLDIVFATQYLERDAVVFNQTMSLINVWVSALIIFFLKLANQKQQEAVKAELEKAAQLKQKNKELQELTYVASHDLQEPVRTISSFSDLLVASYNDKLDDEAKQYLRFIREASARSQQLIVDLLDYNRIGQETKTERVDLNTIVSEVLADLSVKIKEENAIINCKKLPTVKGQLLELRLLFQNLISNAIKFHKPDAPPEINITAKRQNGHYEFSVSDNGIGIDETYHSKIFVVFKRLHKKDEYDGTGIGLAHCKKILEHHNGDIWVESTPGEGSTFFFTLPA